MHEERCGVPRSAAAAGGGGGGGNQLNSGGGERRGGAQQTKPGTSVSLDLGGCGGGLPPPRTRRQWQQWRRRCQSFYAYQSCQSCQSVHDHQRVRHFYHPPDHPPEKERERGGRLSPPTLLLGEEARYQSSAKVILVELTWLVSIDPPRYEPRFFFVFSCRKLLPCVTTSLSFAPAPHPLAPKVSV